MLYPTGEKVGNLRSFCGPSMGETTIMTTRSRAALRRRSAPRIGTAVGDLARTAALLARSSARHYLPSAADRVGVDTAAAEAAFEYCPAGLVVTDAEHRILRANPAFERLTGLRAADLVGRDPRTLTAERHDEDFHRRQRQTLVETGQWQGEVWNRHADGQDYPVQLTIDRVRDAQEQPCYHVLNYRDISGFKATEAELDRVANSDALTGLPNRRLLTERLRQAITAAERTGRLLALCFLDLDGFKTVNDTHGHATGDGLLVTVARRLLGVMRESDSLARLGGDEFALLFNGFNQAQDVEAVLGRVLAAVAAPVRIGPVRLQISASIGVAIYPGDGPEPDLLLRQADLALYQAKRAGKAQYKRFDSGMEAPDAHRPRMPPRLVRALAQHEFRLSWLPQIDLGTNAVVGAEAQLYWQHPRRGPRPAEAFMPAVAGTDLDLALGDWVIDAVMTQSETWHTTGLRLRLGASLSHHYLLNGDLPARLGRALVRHPSADPRNLELLVPESAVLADPSGVASALSACHSVGVHLTLNDFGATDTALTYIRGLPVDRLKLTPGLVRDMLDDPGDLELVESALRLATAFDHPIIAAGVESLEQAALFATLGGVLAEGPGITPALAAAELPTWLERWSGAPPWLQMDRRVRAREDATLMVAAASHRRWIAGLVQHLDDPRGTELVAVASRDCRFGHWYHGRGKGKYGELPEYRAIDPLHEDIHRLGAELLELCRNGRVTAAWARLPELYGLRDRLLAEIDALITRTGEMRAAAAE